MEKEIEAKKKIIEELEKIKLVCELTEEFTRGYIMGAEAQLGVELPSYWYDEVIRKVGVIE